MERIGTKEAWEQLFDPYDEELIRAPYSHYRQLRSVDPVHWSPPLRSWVLTRMEDIQAVLDDDNFVVIEISKAVTDLARRAGRNYDPLISVLDATLFFTNGERHRRDRRTISKLMNRTSLKELRPVIERFASSLASRLVNLPEYDVIAEFADPFPQYVMAYILGLPLSDVSILNDLLSKLTLVFDPVTLKICDEANEKAGAAIELMKNRIVEAVAGSEETGLAILYSGTEGSSDKRVTDAAATALFSYRVGAETTTGLIGLLARTLIQQPWLRQKAEENASLRPAIVAEVLRLESNVQRLMRISRDGCVIGGKTIGPGERLLLLLGAANRDPDAFAKPDTLCPNRKENGDLVFGAGTHFCLGASLARLEGEVALNQVLSLPTTVQSGDEQWYLGRSIRRLVRFPVRVAGPTRTFQPAANN